MTNTFFELDARAAEQERARDAGRKFHLVGGALTAVMLGAFSLSKFLFPQAYLVVLLVGLVIGLAVTLIVAVPISLKLKPCYVSPEHSPTSLALLIAGFATFILITPDTLLGASLQALAVALLTFASN